MRFLLLLRFLLSSLPGVAAAQTVDVALDVSGARLYWQVVDGIADGRLSADSARSLLATHPGYRQIDRNGSRLPVMRYCFLRMMPGVRRDTVTLPPTNRAWLYPAVCDHLDRVAQRRPALDSFALAVERDPGERQRVGDALRRARTVLPAAANELPAPVIHAMLFEQNGFGGETIAIDLLSYMERTPEARERFLAHELYHSLRLRLPGDVRETSDGDAKPGVAHGAMLRWLLRTQEEGIASLLDKSTWIVLTAQGPRMASGLPEGTPHRHAQLVERAREMLADVDDALRLHGQDTASTAGDSVLVARLEATIADGGHAVGHYMALAIATHGGLEAVRPVSVDRFAFIMRYQQAAQASPTQFRVFSEDAMRVFERLAERYRSVSG